MISKNIENHHTGNGSVKSCLLFTSLDEQRSYRQGQHVGKSCITYRQWNCWSNGSSVEKLKSSSITMEFVEQLCVAVVDNHTKTLLFIYFSRIEYFTLHAETFKKVLKKLYVFPSGESIRLVYGEVKAIDSLGLCFVVEMFWLRNCMFS